MEEIWKDIKGYEGVYQVSNYGKAKALAKYNSKGVLLKEKDVKLGTNQYGYLRFNVTKEGKQKTLHIHRVVMETFNPIEEKMQVNHKDGNKENNIITNLEWCTDSENKIHAYKNGLMKGGNEYSKVRQDLPRYKLKSTNLN